MQIQVPPIIKNKPEYTYYSRVPGCLQMEKAEVRKYNRCNDSVLNYDCYAINFLMTRYQENKTKYSVLLLCNLSNKLQM